MISRAHRVTPLTAIQNIYSMVERDSESRVIPYCLENNIGMVPFSPIASGLLSGKITTETKFEKNDDVRTGFHSFLKRILQATSRSLTF